MSSKSIYDALKYLWSAPGQANETKKLRDSFKTDIIQIVGGNGARFGRTEYRIALMSCPAEDCQNCSIKETCPKLNIERSAEEIYRNTGNEFFNLSLYRNISYYSLKRFSKNPEDKTSQSIPVRMIEDVMKSHDMYNGDPREYVECKICGYRCKDLVHHVIRHDMTHTEYVDRYSGELICEKSKNRLRGKNNPAYGHGGKYSPFSPKFIKYQDQENPEELAREFSTWVIKECRPDDSYNTKIDHYLKQGMSEQQAQDALLERQRTFTKEKCVQKYGEEEGLRVWQDRQDRWLASLYDRSDEEMEEIHRKKSTKVNFKSLWGRDLDIPGIFYLLRLANGCVKIGVTSRTLNERYSRQSDHQVITTVSGNIHKVFGIEQVLKKELNPHAISRDEQFGEYGWTETFRSVDLEILLHRLDQLSSYHTDKLFEIHETI